LSLSADSAIASRPDVAIRHFDLLSQLALNKLNPIAESEQAEFTSTKGFFRFLRVPKPAALRAKATRIQVFHCRFGRPASKIANSDRSRRRRSS